MARIIAGIMTIALISFLSIMLLTDSQAASEGSCPDGCTCLSDEEAEEEGLDLCNDELIECLLSSGMAAAPEYGHCYQTSEEGECPENCVCLAAEKAEALGYGLCNEEETECKLATGAMGKCYEVTCPDGCECVTEAVAKGKGYGGFCDDTQTLCGYDDDKNPKYCYIEPAGDDGTCHKGDIDLRQVHLANGKIKFIADTSCLVDKIEMIVGGVKVKECAGGYCEYTGGPYEEQAVPSFLANLLDNLTSLIAASAFVLDESAVSLSDIPQLAEYAPCPYCPEPEAGWGECINQTCEGTDFPQVYDEWSHVEVTSCNYENYTSTGGQFINLGEGLVVQTRITDPVFDHCIDDRDIALHWCQNGVRVVNYTYTCPYGCNGGRCICSDTDGGMDIYEYGGVRNGTALLVPGTMDYCLDNETLREYYTEIDNDHNTCTIRSADFECPGVCRNGACHGTCDDGIQNEGETGIDCGGPCLAACEYDIGWYAQNYGFKFSNPAGQHLSYGDCWSTAGSCGKGYGHYKDTFGNCEVCICHCFGSCCGWHIHAGLYYAIYKYLGASDGQCTGMSLSSLKFYYGDKHVPDYDPLASEVKELDYTGSLKEHIAARQGKVVSGENIDHFLFHHNYWGADDVLNKAENDLNKYPPDYGMIFIIEDNGWGGWKNTVRQTSSAHTLVATNVEHVNNTIARIYLYDSNVPVDVNPTSISPYYSKNSSPYIEINKNTHKYTFIDNPGNPITDNEGEPWSDENDELFDRIGYISYSKLSGDVDIPWEWDLLIIGIVAALGSSDAQVEDDAGRTLGFSDNGIAMPTIPNASILPVFGMPGLETPDVFALPMGDYQVHVRGTGAGNYSAYILGDSPNAFSIQGVGVSETTRDTISIHYGTNDIDALSFDTSDPTKQYSIEIAGVDEVNATETLFRVTNATISAGSRAIFSVDPGLHSLIYTNHGNEPVTYSLQVYSAPYPVDNISVNVESDGRTVHTGGSILTQVQSEDMREGIGERGEGYLEDIIDNMQITSTFNLSINPMETHILAPEDWSNLKESEIDVAVEQCGDNTCAAHENHNSCPEDCASGGKDNYCDGIEDGRCDPDCEKAADPDCTASSIWPVVGGIVGGILGLLLIITVVVLTTRRMRATAR